MQIVQHAPCLVEIRHALPALSMSALSHAVESLPPGDGFAPAGLLPGSSPTERRTADELSLDRAAHLPLVGALREALDDTLAEGCRWYRQAFSIEEPLSREPWCLLRYREGGEYSPHYDGTSADGRCVSAVAHLSEAFTGGALHFPHFHITIPARRGSLLLFPSGFAYRHAAQPVTRGTRIAAVTWLHDQPLR